MTRKISIHAKLTAAKVREIRRELARQQSQTEVAKKFGVSQATISNLILGKTYRSVA